MKKRSLPTVNEHFEHERNAEITLLDSFVRRNVNTALGCVSIRGLNPHQQLKERKRRPNKDGVFCLGLSKEKIIFGGGGGGA